MSNSTGMSFPRGGINIGHTHYRTDHDGEYMYLGGDVTDDLNWLPVNPRLTSDPDVSSWDTRQLGARWYNKTDQQWKGWNGSDIVLIG